MATIIDSLIVTLGLDGSGFAKGVETTTKAQKKLTDQAGASSKEIQKHEKVLSKAQAERAKELEARSKSIAQGLSKIRNEALGLLAVFTAGLGLKNFAVDTVASAAGLDRMSANLGMSAKDLSMWQLAAKHAGGSAEGMTSQLKTASSDIAALRMGLGASAGLQASFRYGVNSSDLKNSNTLLMKQSDILKKMYDVDPTKAAEAAKAMGIGDDAFQLMKDGSVAVERQRQAQAALADEMARAAKPAEELRKKFDDLKNRLESMAVKILTALMPVFDRLLVKFNEFSVWADANKDQITAWIDGIATAVSTAANIILPLLNLIAAGWKNIFQWVKAAGEKVNEFLPQAAKNYIGKKAAEVAEFFGSKEAKEALGHSMSPAPKAASAAPKTTPLDSQAAPPVQTASPLSKGISRGVRNANPGNIRYGRFAVDHGATSKDDKGFAIFPNMQAGQAAQQALLGNYLRGGTDTIGKVINKWAPSTENNTSAYVAAVSKQLGIGADQKLSAAQIPALADAISRHENGAQWKTQNAMAAVNMPYGAATVSTIGGNTSTSTTEVKIGAITVTTQATDAAGVAKSLRGELTKRGYVTQANSGIS